MPRKPLVLDLPIYLSRYIPGPVLAETARRLEASGVIDSVTVWDQTAFFFPKFMWTPEITQLATFIKDIESWPDPFATLGYVNHAAPNLALSIGTDAVRRSPAELMQAALTLSVFSGGNVTLHLGAGEIKNQDPFGWNHKQGLSRLRDHFQAFHALWEADGPTQFEGKWWKFDGAWVGQAGKELPRPRVHGLGGGPMLLDITTSYGDGFTTSAPIVASSPEHWAEMIETIRHQVESKGRDPEQFQFALYPICSVIHEDENVLDRVRDNKLIKLITGLWGRINQSDWLKEGFEPPMGTNWHYANDYFPYRISEGEVDEILSRVTPKMVEKALVIGTPQDVARRYQQYVDAGTDWLQMGDFAPWVIDPEDGARSLDRCLDVARRLKARTAG